MAGKELTCVSYVIMPDGRSVPADELTPEEEAQWQQNMIGRLGESMSDFYTQHPAEYSKLRKKESIPRGTPGGAHRKGPCPQSKKERR